MRFFLNRDVVKFRAASLFLIILLILNTNVIMSNCCCSENKNGGNLEIGKSAPEFTLPNTNGSEVSLSDFRGNAKALVVAFWCNHCPYVIKTEDRMIRLGKKYIDKKVSFVLINANDIVNYPQDSPDRMKQRVKEKGYPFPYLFDEDQSIARAYDAKVTPHIFLFDSDLILRYRGAIDDNINDENSVKRNYLEDAIDALLTGKPEEINPQDTQPVGCSVKWK